MLTSDQKNTLEKVMGQMGGFNEFSHFNPDFDYLTIGGFAGTGKTHLIGLIRNEIRKKWKKCSVAFVSFTGKASSVLYSKLKENKYFFAKDFCGTIHSLMYTPVYHFDKKINKMVIKNWIKKQKLEFDLIFIDEASMVNKIVWDDLKEYNIPIIAVGDHGQLPPVGDDFSLMAAPQYILTEVKRQSLENPLIRLSQEVRMGGQIPYGFYDKKSHNIFKLNWNTTECKTIFNKINFNTQDIIILCGFNATRVSINQMIRNKLNFHGFEPYPGERVICLKNNKDSKIMNGMLGSILFLMYEDKDMYNMSVMMDGTDNIYTGIVYNGCFNTIDYAKETNEIFSDKYQKHWKKIKNVGYNQIDLFDFGYCISVHKSQGSEWKKVILFEERSHVWDDLFYSRWLYTAITRAKEKLFVIN